MQAKTKLEKQKDDAIKLQQFEMLKKAMKKPNKIVGALLAISILAACQTTNISERKVSASDSSWVCLAFEPINWASNDTQKTVDQIKQHNAVWDEICVSTQN